MGQERVARKLSVGFESFALLNQPKTDVNLRFSSNNLQRLAALLDPHEQEEFLLLWKPQPASSAGGAAGAALVPGAAPRFGLASSTAATAAAAAAAGVHVKVGAATAHELLPSVSEDVGGTIKAKLTLGSSTSSSACASVDGDSHLVSSSSASSDVEMHVSDGEDCCCSSSSSSGAGSPARGLQQQHQQHGAKLSPEQQAILAEMRAVPVQWKDFHTNLGAFLYCSVFRMPEPAQLLPITKEQVISWLNIKPEDAFVRHQFHFYK